MKIYFIGQKGIPAAGGGIEKHVEEQAARLVQAGHEVYVYARPNYTAKSLKKYRGVNLISLPSIGTKHLDAISHTFFACLDLLKREVDIVNFHAIGPSSLIWLVKILKPGVPIVFTFHCQDYHHQKWGLIARTYLKLGEKIGCLLADKVITTSKILKKYCQEKYGVKSQYIPTGLPVNKDAKKCRGFEKWGLKKNEYIVSVSRLVRHKGVHYLINAYNQLKTDKKLVIVGDGSFTDDYVWELKTLAYGNPNIIFTGNQSGETLLSLFANACLFVQPSEAEGLSIALLEAMSYGVPALASDIPANIEAVGKSGFFFENKNAKDLTAKLAYLLPRTDLLKKKSKEGVKRVESEYNWDEITEKTINVFYQTIKDKQSSRHLPILPQMAKKIVNFIF